MFRRVMRFHAKRNRDPTEPHNSYRDPDLMIKCGPGKALAHRSGQSRTSRLFPGLSNASASSHIHESRGTWRLTREACLAGGF